MLAVHNFNYQDTFNESLRRLTTQERSQSTVLNAPTFTMFGVGEKLYIVLFTLEIQLYSLSPVLNILACTNKSI